MFHVLLFMKIAFLTALCANEVFNVIVQMTILQVLSLYYAVFIVLAEKSFSLLKSLGRDFAARKNRRRYRQGVHSRTI
jgi:hypothetical protein